MTSIPHRLLGVTSLPEAVKVQQAGLLAKVCLVTVPGLQRPLWAQSGTQCCKWMTQNLALPISTRIEGKSLRPDSCLYELISRHKGGHQVSPDPLLLSTPSRMPRGAVYMF